MLMKMMIMMMMMMSMMVMVVMVMRRRIVIAVFRLKLPASDVIAASKFSCYADADADALTFPPDTVEHRWCQTER